MNKRRKLVIALGAGVLGISFASVAQTQKVYRVGILFAGPKDNPSLQGFMLELRTLGYIEGQNASIISRIADGHLDRLPALAAELVAEKVDVIFASSTPPTQAARQVAGSIPIVFSAVSDPVGQGAAKRLQILKEMVPKTSRVVVLITDEPQVGPQVEQAQQAAKRLGMNVTTTQVLSRDDFEGAKKLLRSSRTDSLYVADSVTNMVNRKLLIEFAAQNRLPAIYAQILYADDGGLFSYGANQETLARRAAHYVDKILKGAKPSDLPIEQPTKFELVINMKTAKALGIKIPKSILVQANKVIE